MATLDRDQPTPAAPLIELRGVEKTYRMGTVDQQALRGVDLTITAGEMVAVVGPSGSGKSTILNMITGIDKPTAGEVWFDGERLDRRSEEALAVWPASCWPTSRTPTSASTTAPPATGSRCWARPRRARSRGPMPAPPSPVAPTSS